MDEQEKEPGFLYKLVTSPLVWIAAAVTAIGVFMFGGQAMEYMKSEPDAGKGAGDTGVKPEAKSNMVSVNVGKDQKTVDVVPGKSMELVFDHGKGKVVYNRGHANSRDSLFQITETETKVDGKQQTIWRALKNDEVRLAPIKNGKIDLNNGVEGLIIPNKKAPQLGEFTVFAAEQDKWVDRLDTYGTLSPDKISIEVHALGHYKIKPQTLRVASDTEGNLEIVDPVGIKKLREMHLDKDSADKELHLLNVSLTDGKISMWVRDLRTDSPLYNKQIEFLGELNKDGNLINLDKMEFQDKDDKKQTIPIPNEIHLKGVTKKLSDYEGGTWGVENLLFNSKEAMDSVRTAIDTGVFKAKQENMDLGMSSPVQAKPDVAPEIIAATEKFKLEKDKMLPDELRDLKGALPSLVANNGNVLS